MVGPKLLTSIKNVDAETAYVDQLQAALGIDKAVAKIVEVIAIKNRT